MSDESALEEVTTTKEDLVSTAQKYSEILLKAHSDLLLRERKLDESEETLVKKRQAINDKKQQLCAAARDLTNQRARVVDHNLVTLPKITLNVGGTPMEASRATLISVPGSLLAAIFSGRYHILRGMEK